MLYKTFYLQVVLPAESLHSLPIYFPSSLAACLSALCWAFIFAVNNELAMLKFIELYTHTVHFIVC